MKLLGDLRHHVLSLARVRAVFAVAAVLVVVQAVFVLAGRPDGMVRAMGLGRDAFFGGAAWQIATYGLLHGSWLHLAVNVLALVVLGTRVEWIFGARALIRVVVYGLLVGGALHLAVLPGGAGAPVLVGFSAAVVALLLLITTVSPESRMWPLPVRGRALGLGIMVAEGLLAAMDPAVGLPYVSRVGDWICAHGGESWFMIAHVCHFGGGLAGWIFGRWVLRQRVTKESLRSARERREAM